MKKIVVTILSIVVISVLFFGCCVYQHYVPVNVATMPVSTKNTHGWKTYHNERFGFEIKYPDNYFLCRHDFDHISLEEYKTCGKRISLRVFQLDRTLGFHIGGHTINLTEETTVDDIAQQFLEDDNRPLVHRSCYPRDINGNNTIICTTRAPGEMPWVNGDIFIVFVLGIYEMENGERILVKIDNDGGGTPYTSDRALQRDVIRVFHTLRWTSYRN